MTCSCDACHTNRVLSKHGSKSMVRPVAALRARALAVHPALEEDDRSRDLRYAEGRRTQVGEANCKGVTQSGDAKPGWGKGSGSTQKAGRRRRATQKGNAEGRRRKGDWATQKGDAEGATGRRRRATQRAKVQDDTLIDGGYAGN